MDPISQGITGAIAAQLGARRDEIRWASLAGFAAGCAADLDVLIPRGGDPLGALEHHRHFTHALVFIPVGALAVALVLALPFLLGRRLPFARLYVYSTLGYATHGALDALTTYGTHLFWPLSADVVATGTIAIVDPVFTLALGAAVAVAAKTRSRRAALAGAAFAIVYFAAGFVQKSRADAAADALARSRGHTREVALVKTTMANLVLWRSVYGFDGRFYVDAVRAGLEVTTYPGTSVARFERARDLSTVPADSPQGQDLARFTRFSQGFVARSAAAPDLVGDLRFSVIPNAAAPLWAVRVSPHDPARRVEWVELETATKAERRAFTDMLFGRP